MSGQDQGRPDLSEISTCWSEIQAAHLPAAGADRVQRARERTLVRYRDAIIRYVRSALKSQDAAEEVYQTFSLRFMRGDFRNVNPDRGRFRDYLKASLFRLVKDHQRQVGRLPRSLNPDLDGPGGGDAPSAEDDRRFLACWRDQLFECAMTQLQERERKTRRPLASVLQAKMDHPDWHYDQFADLFSARLGRPIKVESIRKLVMEARKFFRESLVREVYQTLDRPSLVALEEELIDLGLHEVCRSVLHRKGA